MLDARTKLACLATLCASATLAAAQPAPSSAEADRLFEAARTALTAGDAKRACPLFEQSYALDPARGTLLNLAACYERVGQRAAALRTFREVAGQALAAHDQVRVDAARIEIARLTALVHRVQVILTGAAPSGMSLAIDDTVVSLADAADWPVEGTQVRVRASAPGFRDATTQIDIPAQVSGTPIRVELPAPEPADGAPVLGTSPAARERNRSRYVISGVVVGTGAALFATSVVLALGAKRDWDDAVERCPGATPCDAEREPIEDARSRGRVATIVGSLGIGAVAAGAALFFLLPKYRQTEAPLRTAITREGVAVQWHVRF